MNIYKKRFNCAVCGNKNLLNVMDYGEVPLAGDFTLQPNDIEKFNLTIKFCDNCYLLQTDSIIHPDRLFKDYRYMSSIGLSKHFTNVALHLQQYFKLNAHSNILEIGSNDGVLLKPLMDLGLNPIGIEPSQNIARIALDKGCNVIVDYFSEDFAEKTYWNSHFDLIISNNCFAHIEDINSITEGIHKALKPNGHLVIEVHYVKPLIDALQYDNIYHEHIYYYSLNSLHNLFSKHQMTIVDFEEISTHAGSLRVYVKNTLEAVNNKVQNKLDMEDQLGMNNFQWYADFSARASQHILDTSQYIQNAVNQNTKIVGYGASGRANILCNLCRFDSSVISYIVDESPERAGRYIAGTDIRIVNKEEFNADTNVDEVLIFAWNFAKMIINKIENKQNSRGDTIKFIIPFPKMKIVSQSSELNELVGL